ncbi:MAG: DUF4286 family protein [Bacteroidota bacterium]|nr:DUF4286 family protein [Bacteroidota bacterium]
MIIYNMTLNIENSVHSEWRKWINDHIPKVLGTGLFLKAVFSKVLTEDTENTTTYSVQYYAHSKSALETYQTQYAQELQSEGVKRFGDKMLSFRTALEFIDEFTANKTP